MLGHVHATDTAHDLVGTGYPVGVSVADIPKPLQVNRLMRLLDLAETIDRWSVRSSMTWQRRGSPTNRG